MKAPFPHKTLTENGVIDDRESFNLTDVQNWGLWQSLCMRFEVQLSMASV